MSSDMVRDEVRSQLYAFLADRTIQPVGYEWEHDRLRVLIDSLMELPAMQGLMTARAATFRERYELMRTIERVRAIVDRVAADPSNATDELWVYSIRKALDGVQ